MMLRHALVWTAAMIVAASSAIAQSAGAPYRISEGDRLSVSVLEDPSLNQSVLVRPDGRISLPLAGTIEASGRTPEELQSAIRSALARDFIEPPTVNVSLVGLGDPTEGLATIYVLGQVGRPGSLEVELPVDILQALALAGGPNAFGATERIQVRRRLGDRDVVMLFDYDAIEDGAVPANLIPLVDGDVVVVPERGLFE